jgi:CubicO group peptidase (beta-lactamase class C family)
LQSSLDALARAHAIPGLALISIRSGAPSTILTTGNVCSHPVSAHCITAQTLFQLASVSKFISACLVITLAKQKQLDLYQPIDFPDHGTGSGVTVTLAQLLSHRAGFCRTVGFEGLRRDAGSPQSDLDVTVPCRLSYDVQAIGRYHYSGCHYWLLQKLLESELQQSFEQLLQRWLCQPLGLQQTTSIPPGPAQGNVALGHDLNGQPLPGGWRLFSGVEAAAGLWSSPADLERLLTSLLVASSDCDPAAAPLRLQDLVLNDCTDGYHLGVNVMRTSIGTRFSHWGLNPGYQAALSLHLGAGRASAVLVNRQQCDAICDLVIRGQI